jgi:hypothetical protein
VVDAFTFEVARAVDRNLSEGIERLRKDAERVWESVLIPSKKSRTTRFGNCIAFSD